MEIVQSSFWFFQISAMQQKGLDEMLEKVLNDWMAVKEENNKLKNSLSGLS